MAASMTLSNRLGQIRLTLIIGQETQIHKHTSTQTPIKDTHTRRYRNRKSTETHKQQIDTHTTSQLEDQEPIQIENLVHTQAPQTGSPFRMSKPFPHEG